MAFATNQFINGEWTTRTVDVNDVLRHYNEEDSQHVPPMVENVPVLGLLSQTVSSSPMAHWILPVKARHFNLNDVAFIGDFSVQIKELRPDGHLWDIIRKDDVGARIRNARVMGSLQAYEKNPPIHGNDARLNTEITDEDEDGDVRMGSSKPNSISDQNYSEMPPQLLILYLENMDVVFLMLRKAASGEWEFISSRYRCNDEIMNQHQPGTHLAVDPSSRFVAVGPQQGSFAILSLHSREELETQYSQGKVPNPVHTEGWFVIPQTIHKMEFLYPPVNDEDHIILLVLHIHQGRTRMKVYDWMASDDVRRIKQGIGKGHMVAQERQIPLLLIPLTFKSSFILISERSLAVCKDILIGEPKFEEFMSEDDPPTPYHHGLRNPLWTAWTRPYRFPYYKGVQDCIYIVREDGSIRCLEIHTDDDFIRAVVGIGDIQSNCGTALASLDYHHDGLRTGDYLITGGDSGVGAAYLIRAREPPVFQQHIANWSPASDFVTTSKNQDRENEEPIFTGRNKAKSLFQPDQTYACVGKGSNGAILEYRYGLEAHVGLDMEFEAPIENVWVLAPPISLEDYTGSLFLLSLGAWSALLHISSDAASVKALDASETDFDLRYRTITASMHGSSHIQVTEKSIVFMDGTYTSILEGNDLLGIFEDGSLIGQATQIFLAVIYKNIVLFTVQCKGNTYLRGFKPITSETVTDKNGSDNMVQTLAQFPSDITCIAACESMAIAVAPTKDLANLMFINLNGNFNQVLEIALPFTNGGSGNPDLGMILSITTVSVSDSSVILLLCGTSNGYVVMVEVDTDAQSCLTFTYDRVGLSTAHIKKDEYSGSQKGSQNWVLVTCDSKLYTFTIKNFGIKGAGQHIQHPKRTIHRVFLTDARNLKYTQPDVDAVARFLPGNLGGIDDTILLVASSLLIVAGLSLQPKPVPRRIPIKGTPSRLLYSHNLQLLVVGANVNGKSTLLFIDPETGEDVSRPFDTKTNTTVQFIPGLGNSNDKIFRLTDWSLSKDGKTWNFIILCTSSGRLVLVSVEREERPLLSEFEEEHQRLPKVRYWMRHKFKCGEPIYCVTSFPEGLIYCSGKTLHCDVLDLAAKKFKSLAKLELPSPAINVVYEKGDVYILTSCHSLEIYRLATSLDGGTVFVRTHGDQVTRQPLHHRILGPSSPGERHSSEGPNSSWAETPLHLISDKGTGVTGLWAISNTKADTLETLFEAELPHSILKFRYGRSRPIWDPTWASYGCKNNNLVLANMPPNSAKYPEILGLSIDGSLSHFTILDHASWKLLRFLTNIVIQSPIYSETLTAAEGPKWTEPKQVKQDLSLLEPVLVPRNFMHINGDVLKECLDRQLLEDILQIRSTTDDAVKVHAMFKGYLKELLGGKTKEFLSEPGIKQPPRVTGLAAGTSNKPTDVDGGGELETIEQLVYEAYNILELFFRPVL